MKPWPKKLLRHQCYLHIFCFFTSLLISCVFTFSSYKDISQQKICRFQSDEVKHCFFKLLQNMVESFFFKVASKHGWIFFKKSCFKTWLNLFLKVASKHGWIFFKLLQNRKAFFPHKRCILVCLQMMFAQTFCSSLITWKN